MRASDLLIFKNIPTLKTERLILRRMEKSDYKDVFAYASDARVSEYLLWSPHTDISQTKSYLRNIDAKYKRAEFYDWGIVYDGSLIGTVGFTSLDTANNVGEIGYVLSSKYWGLGIAVEAAERIIEFGFSQLNLDRIEARYMVENLASRRVLDKLSMKNEGVFRSCMKVKGKRRDIAVASILREEYEGM